MSESPQSKSQSKSKPKQTPKREQIELTEEGGEATGFSDAMAELESILRRIEGEEIDIDELATELRRATELLEMCRGKIKKAEVEVNQIIESLE